MTSKSPELQVFDGLGSGLLSDAMDTLGLRCAAQGGFRATHSEGVVIGRAFTVRQILIGDDPNGVARHGEVAESLLSPGDVLIIDVPNAVEAASWGEGHALRALGSGAGGVVVNGPVRDTAALGQLPLPVLYRRSTPRRSKGRLVTAEIGGAVMIGETTISAGDFVCFDADGLVAFSADQFDAVMEKAQEILVWEQERNARLQQRL